MNTTCFETECGAMLCPDCAAIPNEYDPIKRRHTLDAHDLRVCADCARTIDPRAPEQLPTFSFFVPGESAA